MAPAHSVLELFDKQDVSCAAGSSCVEACIGQACGISMHVMGAWRHDAAHMCSGLPDQPWGGRRGKGVAVHRSCLLCPTQPVDPPLDASQI